MDTPRRIQGRNIRDADVAFICQLIADQTPAVEREVDVACWTGELHERSDPIPVGPRTPQRGE